MVDSNLGCPADSQAYARQMTTADMLSRVSTSGKARAAFLKFEEETSEARLKTPPSLFSTPLHI